MSALILLMLNVNRNSLPGLIHIYNNTNTGLRRDSNINIKHCIHKNTHIKNVHRKTTSTHMVKKNYHRCKYHQRQLLSPISMDMYVSVFTTLTSVNIHETILVSHMHQTHMFFYATMITAKLRSYTNWIDLHVNRKWSTFIKWKNLLISL